MDWEEEEEKKEGEDSNIESQSSNKNDQDSDNDKRKVKTPKQKLKELILNSYSNIKSSIKNNNYKQIHETLEKILKNTDKFFSILGEKEMPILLLELFVIVDEAINISKEEQKKLSKEQNVSYHNIRKSLNKNKKFENLIKKYKENRPTEDELKKEQENFIEKNINKSESISHLSDSEEDEIDIIELMKKDENKTPAERRLKWVKKEKKKPIKEDGKNIKQTKIQKKIQPKKEEENINLTNNEKQNISISEKEIELEYEEIHKHRGQNKTPNESISRLELLYSITKNNFLKIKLLIEIILMCFDTSSSQFNSFPLNIWGKNFNYIGIIINLFNDLNQNKNENSIKNLENIISILQNNLTSLIEKLEIELYKSLQFSDNNTMEYYNWMKNEFYFLNLCKKIEKFYQEFHNSNALAKIYLLVIMHIYYKQEDITQKFIKKFNIKIEDDDYIKNIIISKDKIKSKNNFDNLIDEIYKHLDDKNKIKSMLFHIYFLCVHNFYKEAKFLFKASYSFDLINTYKDENLKSLYNRTLAQLGICSFKHNQFKETLYYLIPLCSNGTNKLKDYLSQSYKKENEKNILYDKDDKKRAIPFIMNINIDEVECIFYLCSMLVDLPHILLNKLGLKNKKIGLFFYKNFNNYEKQIFNGPSESNKERILAASNYLLRGDWKNCIKEINGIKIFNNKYNFLLDKINHKIKQIGFKCFLIFYMNEYESFDINNLSERFELETKDIKKLCNELILKEELNGKFNENILNLKFNERDSVNMMKTLVDNTEIICQQNLELIQAAFARKKEE